MYVQLGVNKKGPRPSSKKDFSTSSSTESKEKSNQDTGGEKQEEGKKQEGFLSRMAKKIFG